MTESTDIAVVIPTLNAGETWRKCIDALLAQTITPCRTLVIDSSSDDETASMAQRAGLEVINIQRKDFNHGATRQYAAELLKDVPVVVFLTQDAILAEPDSLERLLAAFNNHDVGAAYGRQLPHLGARPIESHARLFNYPSHSHTIDRSNTDAFGIKAPFLSNSFCAYRNSALMAIGGFPDNTIVSEDMFVGAKMLQQGWKLAYVSEATAQHSHSYNFIQEFRRYFDIGAFFSHENWIRETYGSANGEGLRFVKSECRYLLHNAPWLIPSAWLRTAIKFLGFKLGSHESSLPLAWKRKLSGQRYFWKQ